MVVRHSVDRRLPRVALAFGLIFLTSGLLLAGCGGQSLRWEPRVHVVQSGETLYAIAWRYGLSHQDLARWNGLADADLIIPGQRLRLTPAPGSSSAQRAPAGERRRNVSQAPKPLPPIRDVAAPAWVWPTSGPLVRRFDAGAGLSEGIGISGQRGQKIQAAAAGRVVYTGSGLMGYGQLIIIKHNDTYLTAYGHNDRLLVAEGDAVGSGQAIAQMGLGPGGTPLLHFEIRRNGEPLDPLPLLPVR